MNQPARLWRCGAHTFALDAPLLMGILNVTPDSFSDGGQHAEFAQAVAFGHALVEAGAAIVDVGGESTRPGSVPPFEDEELRRVVPVVRELAACGIAVSVDTRHAAVAAAALEAGACIVNDVAGFRDAAMCDVAAGGDAGLVVMHMLGEPHTMQDEPAYADVVADVEAYLLAAARRLEASGVAPERICLDPGVGFGKTLEHNERLLAATSRLAAHGYPLMVAVSRKSYIGARSGIEAPAGRDLPSALCAAAACADGARIARVHDVALTRSVLQRSRRAVIALGGNVGDASATLDAALHDLRASEGVWVARVSPYVQSEPAYYAEQPPFANAVAIVQTTRSPSELLELCHGIEQVYGRVRGVENGPRTLDLDIVDYEGAVSADPALTLPHPRALERAFVVEPLLAIAPGYMLADGTPVTRDGVCVGALIDAAR